MLDNSNLRQKTIGLICIHVTLTSVSNYVDLPLTHELHRPAVKTIVAGKKKTALTEDGSPGGLRIFFGWESTCRQAEETVIRI